MILYRVYLIWLIVFCKPSDKVESSRWWLYLIFFKDAGRNIRNIQCTRRSHAYWISIATRLRSVRYAVPIPEAWEIALRAQTAVSIAALLIIAICHKFWVIVTAHRSRGFIRWAVMRESGGGEARRCCWIHAETALLRVAAGNYGGAIYNVRLLHFVRKTDGILLLDKLHRHPCDAVAVKIYNINNKLKR